MAEIDPRIIELRKRREKAALGGGEDRIAKQHAKGKLTARERLNLLLDPGTFMELDPFVLAQRDELGLSDERLPGDGVVIGFGKIDGRTVYAYAQDFTVMGGALGEMHGRKICQVMDMAAASGAPIVGMIDSGGARIQEGVRGLGGYAEVFKRNAQYSGVIPQISLILGPCAGGAAYSPAVTDVVIMVEKQSYMFLTGPNVIKSVTGEVIDSEGLGGAKVHLGISGTAHLTTPNEQDAIALTRRLLGYFPSNNVDNAPVIPQGDDPNRMDPALNSLVPLDPSEPYSMRDAIEMIVDQGTFIPFQDEFARNALTGFARMDGMSVGIVSQEPYVMAGVLDIDSADKIARFVRTCDAFNIPIVTFIDSPGFLPGVDQEHRGVIRHGAKVLYAYAESTVPKVSIVTRKAYGGAYVVMSSKYMGTDVTYAWPSAEIAVMGGDGAVNILYRKQLDAAADPAEERKKVTQQYKEQFLNPYAAAEAGYIDEVIEPAETRSRVIAALHALRDKNVQTPLKKHGNIPL